MPLLQKEWKKRPIPVLSNSIVAKHIQGIVEPYAPRPVIIVIDALDEALELHLLLKHLMKVLKDAKGLLKIFVSGRPDRLVAGLLTGYPIIRLEAQKSKSEIRRYIEEQVPGQLTWRIPEDYPLREEIVTILNEKAAGMSVRRTSMKCCT